LTALHEIMGLRADLQRLTERLEADGVNGSPGTGTSSSSLGGYNVA
jgi:hypothetical protein